MRNPAMILPYGDAVSVIGRSRFGKVLRLYYVFWPGRQILFPKKYFRRRNAPSVIGISQSRSRPWRSTGSFALARTLIAK